MVTPMMRNINMSVHIQHPVGMGKKRKEEVSTYTHDGGIFWEQTQLICELLKGNSILVSVVTSFSSPRSFVWLS